MGNWSMHIEGHGIHDNDAHPADADELMRQFVHQLAQAGQQVAFAAFTSGAQKELISDGGASLSAEPAGWRHRP